MMMNAEEKKRMTTMKRRKITVIIAAIILVIMSVALAFVLDYARTTTVIDPADDAKYYIRYKDKAYALYYSDKKTKLPIDSEYGYYITKAQTLIEVDPETGEYTIQAVLADRLTEGNEAVDFAFKLLLFPHIEKANIRSLEVHNETGTYTFARINEKGEISNTGDFVILGSPLTAYSQELFAELHVSAGYTLSSQKLDDRWIEKIDGKINYAEYGLVPIANRERLLDDGTVETYDYTPAYYILTDISGNKYKVIIGDRLVTGGGYYAQYVDMTDGKETPREAVYVLNSEIANSLLAPIENYVTPLISYPMTMNTYFDVEDFKILKRDESRVEDDKYEEIVSFTYIDIAERENSIKSSEPYVFNENSTSPAAALKGYQPSSTNISTALSAIYAPSYVGVHKFAPDSEDFVKAGLWREAVDENGESILDKDGKKTYEICAEYSVGFKYDIVDNGEYVETIQQIILVSAKNEKGNRYVFTTVYAPATEEGKKAEYLYDYNMIVEIEGHSLGFLEWDSYEWINSNYISFNIAFVESIKLESPGYSAQFKLDNSNSDQSAQITSNLIQIIGSDSSGRSTTTFSKKEIIDVNGIRWVITATEIKAYDALGVERTITSSRYEYNKLGTQVKVDTGGIKDRNGDVVYVEADYIKITHPNGTTDQICRFDTPLFRKFYQTLLAATIIDSYPTTDEERAEILSGEPILTLTITTTEKEEFVYRFYELTTRKSYITINGNGGFYVSPNRVQKFISDAQKFFNLEIIDANDKF